MKKKKKPTGYIWFWIAAAFSVAATGQLLLEGDFGSAFFGVGMSCAFGFLGWNSFSKARKMAEDEKNQIRIAEETRIRAEETRQRYWSTHGEINCSVAGVTFDNDDGSSRQRILKGIASAPDDDGDVTLQRFEYQGEPAVRVLYDGRCIGNIRKNDLREVLPILDRVEFIGLDVESFFGDEGEKIYRADLSIRYTK